MANTRGSVNLRSSASKQSFLPPKSPFPIIPPSYADHGCIGSKGNLKQREGHTHHQRTSSESFLIEEQPSWLDDLLNEPETPTKRGSHRRSSSDSFTFMDSASMYLNCDKTRQENHRQRGITSLPPWGAQGFDHSKDAQHVQYHPDANFFGRSLNRGWESPLNSAMFHPNTAPVVKEKIVHHGSLCVLRNSDAVKSDITEKEQEGSAQDLNAVTERKGGSNDKLLQSEVDAKRAKQQFAQRSRVRKLQYIAELERNVQALQAEGLEVSADIEFLSQKNIILDLENKTLKQRLESIAQEQIIKHFQQEMFEREIARLRSLYQQQQQRPAVTHNHSSSSRDLDLQFGGLSLKLKHPNIGRDPVTGVLRI